jgi:hypothetical protein
MIIVGKKEGGKEFKDKFIENLIDYLKVQERGQKTINDTIIKLENELNLNLR